MVIAWRMTRQGGRGVLGCEGWDFSTLSRVVLVSLSNVTFELLTWRRFEGLASLRNSKGFIVAWMRESDRRGSGAGPGRAKWAGVWILGFTLREMGSSGGFWAKDNLTLTYIFKWSLWLHVRRQKRKSGGGLLQLSIWEIEDGGLDWGGILGWYIIYCLACF